MSLPPLRPYKLSAFHHEHLSRGAKMVEEDGWIIPDAYKSLEEEIVAAKGSAALFDLSPLAKVRIDGLEMEGILGGVIKGPIPRPRRCLRVLYQPIPDPNSGGYVISVTPEGGGECVPLPSPGSQVFVMRLAADEALFVARPSSRDKLRSSLEAITKGCLHVTDLTSAFSGIGVIGPRARELLAKLTELDISIPSFPEMTCEGCGMAEINTILVRADVRDLLGFQIYCDRGYGKHLWEELVDAGEEFGAIPAGSKAWKILNGGSWI